MSEIKIEISGGEEGKTLATIAKYFNIGIRRNGRVVTLIGHESNISEIRNILMARIAGSRTNECCEKIAGNFPRVFDLSDHCSGCKKENCLGCPAA